MTENMPDVPEITPSGLPIDQSGETGDLASPTPGMPPAGIEGPAATPPEVDDATVSDPKKRLMQQPGDEEVSAEGRGVIPSARRDAGEESSDPNAEEGGLLRPTSLELRDSLVGEKEEPVTIEAEASPSRMQPPVNRGPLGPGGAIDPESNLGPSGALAEQEREEDPRGDAWMDHMNQILDKNNHDIDAIIAGANADNVSYEMATDFLKRSGRADLLPKLEERKGEFRALPEEFPDEFKPVEPQLNRAFQKAKDAADMSNNMTDEERIAAVDEAQEEAEGVIQRVAKERKGMINRKLFDEETGLLRKDRRVHRLVVVPGVTILMTLIVAYAALVHAVTKSSTTRVGHA